MGEDEVADVLVDGDSVLAHFAVPVCLVVLEPATWAWHASGDEKHAVITLQ